MEARWLHSRKAGEEKKVVDVHDAAYVLVQCGFDAAVVVSLGDAVHAVAVLHDGVVRAVAVLHDDAVHAVAVLHDDAVHAVVVLHDALVLGQRPTRVQNNFYWCEIQVLHVRQSEMEKA